MLLGKRTTETTYRFMENLARRIVLPEFPHESERPRISTDRDHLWLEREIKTVANVTRCDIAEFLAIAAEIPIRPTVELYGLEDANRALLDLKRGPIQDAKVLVTG